MTATKSQPFTILPNRPTWVGRPVVVEGHGVRGLVEYVTADKYAGVREADGSLSEWATNTLYALDRAD